MEIRDAIYILEIAKTKHVTRAAENLYVTQPTLSKVLKKLELEFNEPLFYRDGHELLPTETGRIVLRSAEIIVNEYNNLANSIQDVSSHKSKFLRFGIPSGASFLFTALITEFTKKYPNIDISFIEISGNQAIEMLTLRQIDVAFPMKPFHLEGFAEETVLSSEVAVAVDASHPWASKASISDEDFTNQFYITQSSGTQVYSEFQKRLRAKGIISLPKSMSLDHTWLLNYARMINVPCVTTLPSLQYFGRFLWPNMVTRSLEPKFPWDLCMVYQPLTEPNTATSHFVHFMQDYLAKYGKDALLRGIV